MKNLQTVTGLISIAALLSYAEANAVPNENNSSERPANTENRFEAAKLVGFAPSKAIRTLETLAYAGGSHFNVQGETQVEASKLAHIIQAATVDKLETKVLPSNQPGYVKLKFAELNPGKAVLDEVQLGRLKNIADYYRLKCDGGTTEARIINRF